MYNEKKIARTNQAENSEARGVLTDMIRKFCSMNEAPTETFNVRSREFQNTDMPNLPPLSVDAGGGLARGNQNENQKN